MTQFLDLSPKRRLAFAKTEGGGPIVVFLGGFKSDMTGTKAMDLEAWAVRHHHGFLRLDYSGHGQSSGRFENGCIGDWADDAAEVIARTTTGPLVLVGSSMGGWIALLLARAMPDRIAGLVGIAAAPDFTDWIWDGMTDAQRQKVMTEGKIAEPSEYGSDPYVYTRRLIEDGRTQRIFDHPLHLPFPVRFLQGMADAEVSSAVAVRLAEYATGPNIRLTLVKDADHRFSSAHCLALIRETVSTICELSTQTGS